MLQSIRSLMAGLIDYAGLFPPAKLEMQPAVESFARSRMGEDEWILGRFICPASRLREFSKIAAVMMPGTHATSGYREYADAMEPWRISVLIDGTLASDLETISAFNAHHAQEDSGRALVDAIELKVPAASDIDAAIEAIPDELFPFFEVPAEMVTKGDCRGFVAALAGNAAAAKIRTGGITAEAFPTPFQIAGFLTACAGARVPFKATAGLHHPIRATYPLTYDKEPPRGMMHGYLNVFLAAAMACCHRIEATKAGAILEERDPANFHFTPEGVRWRDLFLETTDLAECREAFALSYGSCSFEEPVEDLKRLGLL